MGSPDSQTGKSAPCAVKAYQLLSDIEVVGPRLKIDPLRFPDFLAYGRYTWVFYSRTLR